MSKPTGTTMHWGDLSRREPKNPNPYVIAGIPVCGYAWRRFLSFLSLSHYVVAASYEKRSLIITTNLEFSKWGGIFTDDQMAAMIDRLAHHGHLIVFEGESYRLKNALMRQK